MRSMSDKFGADGAGVVGAECENSLAGVVHRCTVPSSAPAAILLPSNEIERERIVGDWTSRTAIRVAVIVFQTPILFPVREAITMVPPPLIAQHGCVAPHWYGMRSRVSSMSGYQRVSLSVAMTIIFP